MAEEKRWVEAPDDMGRWCPAAKGEKLYGIYLRKEYKPFRSKDNWAYYFKTDHSIADTDGIAFVYGSTTLNRQMKDVPENQNYELEIEFEGKKANADPKKNATLLYKVRANITKDDPLYKKWYPDETEDTEAAPGATLQTQDHTVTDELIAQYTEVLEDKDPYKKVTCEAIIREAEADGELEPAQLTNIKLRLINLYKTGEIESEEKHGGK